MVSNDRLEQYKTWFRNLSFFGNNSFVLDEIESLWKLVNYIGEKFAPINKYKISEDLGYTKKSVEECVLLVQNFFDRHDISFDVKKLIEDDVLVFLDKTKSIGDKFFSSKADGHSFYDENRKRKISVVLNESSFDAMVMIHELMHYRNQPDGKRNFVSDLLTEIVSYSAEMIFCYDLDEDIYKSDIKLHFLLFQRLMYEYAYQMYYIYKIILLYKEKHDISESLYNEMFATNDYEEVISKFEEYVLSKKSVWKDTWIVIALPMSIYIFEEYRKNRDFFQNLEEFSSSINSKSISACLSILGINSEEELISKIKNSSNSYMLFLEELFSEKDYVKE